MCAPAGGQTGSHPDGELAVARATGAEGTLMALPTGSAYTFDEVAAAATGPLWFQHIHYSDGLTEEYLPLLKPAGFAALVLTVDVVGPFPIADALLTTPSIPSKIKSFANLRQRPDLTNEGGFAEWEPPNLTWDRLDWLRELSGGLPLVLKGVRRTDDARKCLDYGVDGVIVSTHGGRQFDGGLSSIELLPQFPDRGADAVDLAGLAPPPHLAEQGGRCHDISGEGHPTGTSSVPPGPSGRPGRRPRALLGRTA